MHDKLYCAAFLPLASKGFFPDEGAILKYKTLTCL